MAKMDIDKKNINRLYDMYYKALANIREVVESVISNIGVMKKSDYDKNENGIVDNSEKVVLISQSAQVTDTTIRFGVDPDGKWGYIKEGADTVTPFKSGGIEPSGNINLGTITSNGTYTGYDVTDFATASVTVNVPGVVPTGNVNLGTITSNGYKSGFDVSGKATCSFTVQVPLPSGNINLGTITSNGTYTGYNVTDYATASITVNVPVSEIQPTKISTVTPSPNWSGENTNNATITPDSGYDGITTVYVNVPMLRDGTLMIATTTYTPSTVYNGNTAQANSQKLLRMRPTKDGMSYTGSYLYLQPNSYLGNAAPEDVKSGKTFSSSNGIQETGTASIANVQPTKSYEFETFYQIARMGAIISPDAGYDALSNVNIQMNSQRIWYQSSASATGAFTANLDLPYTDFDYISIKFRPHASASPYDEVMMYIMIPVSEIILMNNTSTSKFLLGGRAIQSSSATSGSVYVRQFSFPTTKSVYFHNGQQVGGTGTSNNVMIPCEIWGYGSTQGTPI